MKEDKFYSYCETIEEINSPTGDYFPTVEQLESHKVKEKIDRYLPILIYFAGDPYKEVKDDMDLDYKDEYDKTVAYAKEIVSSVVFDPE